MDEYKQIQCIANMDESYRNKFFEIVKKYSGKLSDHVVLEGSAFTLHDFDHHCFDIFKIISDVIFDDELVYDLKYGLTQKELFILNLAVLFHDIGMFNELNTSRKCHSLKSAEFVDSEYKDSRSTLRVESELTVNELKALKAIIIAHSDIKDGTVIDSENGMHSPKLIDYTEKTGKKIRTKFLAGVLRLADELDVSSDRIGNGELEQKIQEGKVKYESLKKKACTLQQEKELKNWEGFIESLQFWERLHLISEVHRGDDDKSIELVIDDDYINACLDEGKTEKSLAREYVEIHNEIEKKMNEIINLAFQGKKIERYVRVKNLIYKTNKELLDREILDALNIRRLPSSSDMEQDKTKSDLDKKKKVSLKF